MLKLNHKNMNVYKNAIKLVGKIYELTKKFPKEEQFGLTSQLKRAAVSVVSNFSEGASRKSLVERIRFFEISRSSLVEIDTHLEVAMILKYISLEEISEEEKLIEIVFSELSNLITNAK